MAHHVTLGHRHCKVGAAVALAPAAGSASASAPVTAGARAHPHPEAAVEPAPAVSPLVAPAVATALGAADAWTAAAAAYSAPPPADGAAPCSASPLSAPGASPAAAAAPAPPPVPALEVEPTEAARAPADHEPAPHDVVPILDGPALGEDDARPSEGDSHSEQARAARTRGSACRHGARSARCAARGARERGGRRTRARGGVPAVRWRVLRRVRGPPSVYRFAVAVESEWRASRATLSGASPLCLGTLSFRWCWWRGQVSS